jgi:putative endonuclease
MVRHAKPFAVILSEAKDPAVRSPQEKTTVSRRSYSVYIMTNNYATLYTGVTNDLERRVYGHKPKLVPGFTKKYNLTRLVYYEDFGDVSAAIAREKQIKGWLRAKKVALIESVNANWKDLSEGWSDNETGQQRRPSLRSG